jgi:hypothetical protein
MAPQNAPAAVPLLCGSPCLCRFSSWGVLFTIVLAWLLPGLVLRDALAADADRSSKQILPARTAAFFSVADFDLLREHWEKTGIGQLVATPQMRPFARDLRSQLEEKFTQLRKLRLSWSELGDVDGGEVAVAFVPPNGKRGATGVVVLADVTGSVAAARQLLQSKIRQQVAAGATSQQFVIGGVRTDRLTLPARGNRPPAEIYLWVHDDWFGATNRAAVATEIIARQQATATPPDSASTLAGNKRFQVISARCTDVVQRLADVTWYVDPFAYARAIQEGLRRPGSRRARDYVRILAAQGFDVVQGMGGKLWFAEEQFDVLARTLVYAPRVKANTKLRLAARMLDFPNGNLRPAAWVSANVANHFTFNWRSREAFGHAETLIDALAGEPIFQEVLDGLKSDPKGPMIDVKRELVAHLGDRATFLLQNRVPTVLDSEMLVLAIELRNSVKVSATLKRIMEANEDALEHELGEHRVWEVFGADESDSPLLLLEPDQATDDAGGGYAVGVARNSLLIASHVEAIRRVLNPSTKLLTENQSFQQVAGVLDRLGGKTASFRFFTQPELAWRTNYELFQQGKMPQAKTLLGRSLNRLFEPDDINQLRDQELDGSKLPPFAFTLPYLSPGGFFVRTQPDGWLHTGVLLKRP